MRQVASELDATSLLLAHTRRPGRDGPSAAGPGIRALAASLGCRRSTVISGARCWDCDARRSARHARRPGSPRTRILTTPTPAMPDPGPPPQPAALVGDQAITSCSVCPSGGLIARGQCCPRCLGRSRRRGIEHCSGHPSIRSLEEIRRQWGAGDPANGPASRVSGAAITREHLLSVFTLVTAWRPKDPSICRAVSARDESLAVLCCIEHPEAQCTLRMSTETEKRS